jgi:hypothetical protein
MDRGVFSREPIKTSPERAFFDEVWAFTRAPSRVLNEVELISDESYSNEFEYFAEDERTAG